MDGQLRVPRTLNEKTQLKFVGRFSRHDVTIFLNFTLCLMQRELKTTAVANLGVAHAIAIGVHNHKNVESCLHYVECYLHYQ